MSVQSISLVFEHSKSEGTARLVLLSIANHDGEGGCWPSVATIAREARRSERSVQVALRELVELGELVIHRNDGGTHKTRGDRRPNRYEITINPDDGVSTVTPRSGDGVQHSAPREPDNGVTPATPRDEVRGAVSGSHGVQTSAPEPSLTTHNPPSPAAASAHGCPAHPGGRPNCRACGTTPRQLAEAERRRREEQRRAEALEAARRERERPKRDPARAAASIAAAREGLRQVKAQKGQTA